MSRLVRPTLSLMCFMEILLLQIFVGMAEISKKLIVTDADRSDHVVCVCMFICFFSTAHVKLVTHVLKLTCHKVNMEHKPVNPFKTLSYIQDQHISCRVLPVFLLESLVCSKLASEVALLYLWAKQIKTNLRGNQLKYYIFPAMNKAFFSIVNTYVYKK